MLFVVRHLAGEYDILYAKLACLSLKVFLFGTRTSNYYFGFYTIRCGYQGMQSLVVTENTKSQDEWLGYDVQLFQYVGYYCRGICRRRAIYHSEWNYFKTFW
ncbi:hypothetical protein D9M68_650680 [compost metagenome]